MTNDSDRTVPRADEIDAPITAEILTDGAIDVEHERGTLLAVQRIEQAGRRIDWKIGHVDGTFAEGYDAYDGEAHLFTAEFTTVPSNAPSGRFHDGEFQPVVGSWTEEDGDEIVDAGFEYGEGQDAVEWAVDYFEARPDEPAIAIEEWWGSAKAGFEDEHPDA